MISNNLINSNLLQQWLSALFATLIFLSLFIGITGVGIFAYGKNYLSTFSHAAGLPQEHIIAEVRKGLQNEESAPENFTVLILGVDATDNRAGHPLLTDTLMYVSISTQTGQVNLLPLPRDIWSEAYKTKINALYHYSVERDSDMPLAFLNNSLEEITSVSPDLTIVTSLDQVGELIDIVDGVTVSIKQSFTDEQFPRSDVDLSDTDEENLYETITFTQGSEEMKSQRALKYIRSRKSSDDFGTDIDRSMRQQEVITALSKRILSKRTLSSPEKMGKMFKLYQELIGDQLPLNQAVLLAKELYPQRQNLTINTSSLSLFPDDENGVLENPDLESTQNIWIYRIRDAKLLQSEVRSALGL